MAGACACAQIAMGTFVSYFFSGFILGKIPFPLSPSFRLMLQVHPPCAAVPCHAPAVCVHSVLAVAGTGALKQYMLFMCCERRSF